MIYYSTRASASTSLLPASRTGFQTQKYTMESQDTENDNNGFKSDKIPEKYLTQEQVVSDTT